MYRLIAYLGILASIILGGILGLFASVLAFGALEADLGIVHLLIVIALGASIGGILAVIRVRRYLKELREKQLAKHFASVPENAGELIKSIIRQMRYRKEVRQDVMAELSAHFEDGLKDCKSDEEKDKKAQKLIEDFGDVKLLAVLLRRAKKRCRPLWRTVFARTFQTIGVLILCLIVYLVWFFSGKPVITTDYVAELNRIVRPAADDSLNAAPLYHKAAELSKKLPDGFFEFLKKHKEAVPEEKWRSKEWEFHRRIFEHLSEYHSESIYEEKQQIEEWIADLISRLLGKKYNEVTPEQKQLIEKWLESNNEALELVVAGSKKPYYWRKYSNRKEEYGMMGILLPHLSEFRKLAKALRWKAWLQAEQGQYEDAFDDMKACYRFGQHLRGDKSLIEQLVGMAIEALAAQTIRDILSEHRIDSSVLAELQQSFEQMIADENFTVSLKFEKLAMYDVIQRYFTEDRLGNGHLSLEGLRLVGSMTDSDLFEFILEGKHWTAPLHILFTHPNKQESREMADGLYDYWGQIAHKSPARIRAENIDVEEQTIELVKGNILLEFLTPAIGRVCEIAYRNKIDVEATLTVIAILRYKQDIGGYPDKLEKLINADYLKVLPIDPYSGEPLVYKRTDSDFLLYSFGPNFRDDDGKMAYNKEGKPRWRGTEEDGDTVFWPVAKSQLKQ